MFDYKDFNPTIQKRSKEKPVNGYGTYSSESDPLIKKIPETKILPKWKEFLSCITIEPIMFIQMLAKSLVEVVTENLYIDRICRVTMNVSEIACTNFTTNIGTDEISDEIINKIDGLASTFSLYRDMTETATQVLVALFLGSWSAKYGFKIPLLLPILGKMTLSSLNLLFTFLPDLPPEYLLISTVPMALSGGLVAVILSSFSYIASITTPENRSFRIAVMEGCWLLGAPIGALLGARIYKDLGFRGVYITSAALNLCALMYGLFFMEDKKMKFGNIATCCKDFFHLQGVKNTFYSAFKKRDGSRRMWILLMIICESLRLGTTIGPHTCLFLFTRRMFQWNEQQYSLFTTLEGLSHVVGIILMTTVCIKIWKLSDPLVGVLSCVGLLFADVVVAFAPKGPSYEWIMYATIAIQIFAMMPTILIRSILSKMVPREELEQVFTLLACGENAMPIITSALYSLIFVNTVKYFPGAFSLLSFAMNSVVTITFLYFFLLNRKMPQIMIARTEEEELNEKTLLL